MQHNKFEFVVVLHPDEIKYFTELLKDDCKKVCSNWSFDYDHDGPTKTTLTVKLGFNEKKTLQDVEQWLVSIFGKDKILSLTVLNRDVFERKAPDDYFMRRLRGKYGYYF